MLLRNFFCLFITIFTFTLITSGIASAQGVIGKLMEEVAKERQLTASQEAIITPAPAPATLTQTTSSLTADTDEDRFLPSYGTYKDSLFFTPEEAANYLKVIRLFEKNGVYSPTLEEGDITDPLLQDIINRIDGTEKAEELPPIIYPAYHLGSILYHGQRDWAVSMNGITITKQNNKPDNELYVTAIQSNRASFVWTSQDKRLMQDLKKKSRHLVKNRPVALEHRRVKRVYGLPFLPQQGMTVAFTLEPNQLFYSEYLTLYEGNQNGILPPAPPPPTATDLTESESIGDSATENGTIDAAPLINTPPTAPQAPITPTTPIAPSPQQAAPAALIAVPPQKRNAMNSLSPPSVIVPALPTTLQSIPAQPTSRPPTAIPNSNIAPLEELPSIDTIAP